MDKICKFASKITINNKDTKGVKYSIELPDTSGKKLYELKIPGGTVQAGKSTSAITVSKKPSETTKMFTNFQVIGVSEGVSKTKQTCSNLALGTDYSIIFKGKTVGMECVASPKG